MHRPFRVLPHQTATEGGGGTVPVSPEEHQRLKGLETELNTLRAERQAKEQARLDALAEKGKIDQQLSDDAKAWQAKMSKVEADSADLRKYAFATSRDNTIREAMQGFTLKGGNPEAKAAMAAMAMKLAAMDLDAEMADDGSTRVFDKATRRPAADVLRERFSSEEFSAFFVRAGQAANPAPPSPNEHGQPPADPEREALLRHFGINQGGRGPMIH